MCLAIPSHIVESKGEEAVTGVDGVWREAWLQRMKGPKAGDYVIVHAGYGITLRNERSARESLHALNGLIAGGAS